MPVTIDLYSQTGEKLKAISASEELFNAKVKPDLMHQALIRQQSNARVNLAHTLTKGEVTGGGRKPYRQKGTGRARQGSIRNPHYKGGGVAMGPRNVRNFTKEMPQKQRRLALFSALTSKLQAQKIIALDEYKEQEFKTKLAVAMFKKLPEAKSALIVLSERHPVLERAVRNLSEVKTLQVNYLNIFDLLKYDQVIFLEKAVQKAEEIFSLKTKK